MCQNNILLRCCVFATGWPKRRSHEPDAGVRVSVHDLKIVIFNDFWTVHVLTNFIIGSAGQLPGSQAALAQKSLQTFTSHEMTFERNVISIEKSQRIKLTHLRSRFLIDSFKNVELKGLHHFWYFYNMGIKKSCIAAIL